MVNDSLCGQLKTTIEKVKEIVSFFKHSNLANDSLCLVQKQCNVPPLNLLQECPTRWNSKLAMIKRFVELKEFIILALGRSNSKHTMPIQQQLSVLNDCVNLLEPIELASTQISGQSYVTSSLGIPLKKCLQYKLESINVYIDLGLELKLNLINNLSNHFSYLKNNKIILISTLIDCRFKNLHFSNDEALKAEEFVKQELNQFSPSSQMQNQVNLFDENDIWNYHDSIIKNTLSESNELTVYLSLPV